MYSMFVQLYITTSVFVRSTPLLDTLLDTSLLDNDTYLEITIAGEAAVFSGHYIRRSATYHDYPVYEKKCEEMVCDCQCYPMENITQKNCQVTGGCFVDSSSAGCGDLIPTRMFPHYPTSPEACTHPTQQNRVCPDYTTYIVMFVNDEGFLTIKEMFGGYTSFRSQSIYNPSYNSSWRKLKKVEGHAREYSDKKEWVTVHISVSTSVKDISACSRDIPTMAGVIAASLCTMVLLCVVACIVIKRRKIEEVAEVENKVKYYYMPYWKWTSISKY